MNRKRFDLRRLTKSPAFWLFLSVSLLFGILFFNCIFGKYAYVYEDIGSDTFHINYPLYMMFSDFFHQGSYQDYVLRAGLGMDISSYLYQYLNPLNALVVVLPQRYLPWAILFATYLKLLILAFAAYGLFRRWLSHAWAGMYAALFWTFSGYVMLWGQHYGFCMSMMLFTVFLLLVHLYVEEKETSRNWLLVPWITLMLFSNYYFLYTSGIAGAFFVVWYLAWRKEHPWKILKKLTGLGLMGILGICIGGGCLVATANIFFSSSRADMAADSFSAMFQPYSVQVWLTDLGRFFSNNTFGVGNDYLATINYYESIMLFVTALALPALVFLILKRKTRVQTVLLIVLALAMMGFHVAGQLLNFSLLSLRWSFLLCFLEAFAAGYLIRERMLGEELLQIRVSLAIAAVLTAAGFTVLAIGAKRFEFQLEPVYLILYAAFSAAYFLLLGAGRALPQKRPWVFSFLLLAVVVGELATANFPSINSRMMLTRHQTNELFYNDGTGDAWELLEEMDPSLYRVGRTGNREVNDSMAQGYPGFSVYLTTNSQESVDLKEYLGGEGIGANKVIFEEANSIMRALLGEKYVIKDPELSLPSDAFSYVESAGGKEIWQMEDALPFGYLYDKAWDTETVRKMNVAQRVSAIVSGFYFTDRANVTDDAGQGSADTAGAGHTDIAGTARTDYDEPEPVRAQLVSVLGHQTKARHCKAEHTDEGVRIYNLEDGRDTPYVVWDQVGDALDSGGLHELILSVDPAGLDGELLLSVFYKTGDERKFSYDRRKSFILTPGGSRVSMFLPEGTTGIRIDVDSAPSEVLITGLQISSYPGLTVPYRRLQESKVTDTSFIDETYHAAVENTQEHVQMLCIPLLYGQGWTAKLDGEETVLYNINSGLCGVEIPAGSHEVTLHYESPHKQAGMLLTAAGLAVYAVCFLLAPLWKRKTAAIR